MKRILFSIVLVAASLVAQGWQAPTKRLFYVAAWPGVMLRYDPVTDTVTGQAPFRNGVHHEMVLTADKKRMLVVTGQKQHVEIVDLEKMEVVADHSFARDGQVVRIDDIREIPGGGRWYVRVERIKKLLDRWEILEPEWVEYKLEGREETKSMKELPRSIRNGAKISPDGTKWHVFGKDITIVDPVTLKEEGKIVLSEPLFAGMGAFSLRGDDFFNNTNTAAYRFAWTMTDPVKKNRTFTGRFDIDLATNRIIPESIKEWGVQNVWRVQRTLDNKIGIATGGGRFGGGGGGSRAEGEGEADVTAATYDLETGKKLKEGRARVRENVFLSAISGDGSKSYWTGRGHEFVILDADHKYLKTVELPGEITRGVFTVDS